ncbi:MAG: endonuclease/exonuclease/phosphatase family protein [Rhizobiaceae bacterium]|nr:endonuclease/exonuclease/phosphatase family protein [Rhizobiaceae bacterium]
MILSALHAIRSRGKQVLRAAEAGPGELVVASYNIHKCVGTDGKRDPGRIVDVIGEMDPDVIALQEVDTRFGERRGLLHLERLEREHGLVPVPLSRPSAAHGWHGNIVLYRKGLVSGVHEIDLPGLEPRGALVTELDFDADRGVRIIAAHFGLLRHSRRQQAHAIVDLLRRNRERPTLVLGDLNEWRMGARSALHGFAPAFGPLPPSAPSFPSRLPFLALDRIISNRPGLIGEVVAHETPLSRIASDHLPVMTTLAYDAV